MRRLEHDVRFPMELTQETTFVTANLVGAAIALGLKGLAEQGATNVRLWDHDGLFVRRLADGNGALVTLIGDVP